MLIRCSTGRGPASFIIRQFTWSWCSHIGFKLPNNKVLDATEAHGVAVREVTDLPGTKYYSVLLPDNIVAKAKNWATSQIGKPYDWSGILGIGSRRDWHKDSSWFCSELVAEAFIQGGYPLLREEDAYRITPRDVLLSPLLKLKAWVKDDGRIGWAG